jgi:hypothetical protein
MADYEFSISLRLRHPVLDLAEASGVLKMTPSRSWRAGEPRTTPTGRPLKGFYEASYWTARIVKGESKELDLSTAINEVLSKLGQHGEFFSEFAMSGGKSELFIGWFFGEGNSGDVFEWRLLEKLAELRIDLSFDVYPTMQT